MPAAKNVASTTETPVKAAKAPKAAKMAAPKKEAKTAAPKAAKAAGKRAPSQKVAPKDVIHIQAHNEGLTHNGLERLSRKAGAIRAQGPQTIKQKDGETVILPGVHDRCKAYVSKRLTNLLTKIALITVDNNGRSTIAARDTALALSLSGEEILGY